MWLYDLWRKRMNCVPLLCGRQSCQLKSMVPQKMKGKDRS